MSFLSLYKPDPTLDLELQRYVNVSPSRVWDAWTKPDYLKKWFTPEPWTTVDAEIDLRPGGIFRTVMRSPEGQEFSNLGCYLEIVEKERLIWTSALLPGFRPNQTTGPFNFTAVILIEPQGNGTKYRAIAMHGSEGDSRKHEQRGFQNGWGKALNQLIALMNEP